MRNAYLLVFLLALPALAALGHDVYLFITNGGSVETLQESVNQTLNEPDVPGVKSLFATPGYIWTHYHPESYKWTVENAGPQMWSVINFILAQKAVAVGAVFAGFFYLLFFILSLFGTGPFVSEKTISVSAGRSRIDKVLNPDKKTGRFKYKRK